MNKVGMLAAIMLATGADPDIFPSRPVVETKLQSEEEVLAALEKAQAKRDRKAAKRLKSIAHK